MHVAIVTDDHLLVQRRLWVAVEVRDQPLAYQRAAWPEVRHLCVYGHGAPVVSVCMNTSMNMSVSVATVVVAVAAAAAGVAAECRRGTLGRAAAYVWHSGQRLGRHAWD